MGFRSIASFILLTWTSSICLANEYRLVSGEFPPYSGKDLISGGVATEIIYLATKSMGHGVNVDFLPWKRGYADTLNGTYMGTFPYSKNASREKIWHFSIPMYELKEVFFGLDSRRLIFNTNADLKDQSVCKPIGYNLFGLKALEKEGSIRLERPSEMDACFEMLKVGRVDLVMTNEVTGWELIKSLDHDASLYQVLDKSFVEISHHLIVPKTQENAEAFVNDFNQAIRRLQKDGVISTILQRSHSDN